MQRLRRFPSKCNSAACCCIFISCSAEWRWVRSRSVTALSHAHLSVLGCSASHLGCSQALLFIWCHTSTHTHLYTSLYYMHNKWWNVTKYQYLVSVPGTFFNFVCLCGIRDILTFLADSITFCSQLFFCLYYSIFYCSTTTTSTVLLLY